MILVKDIEMTKKQNQAVLILGMHRSGTSLLTGVLSMLGINAGECLMPAQAAVNPKGFWEHVEIVGLNDQILEALDSSWDDISELPDMWWTKSEVLPYKSSLKNVIRRDFERTPVWLLKDPRLCRLLPLWLEILRELEIKPFFILCLRNPFEVAASLNKRDGIISEEAHLLWLRYVLDSERWSRGYSRIVVTYESVLTDWKAVSNALEQAPGLGVNLREEGREINKRIKEFIEPSLRHHVSPSDQVKEVGTIPKLANKVYQLLVTAPLESVAERLFTFDEQTKELCNIYFPWANKMKTLRKQVLENTWQQTELARVKSTVSWQLTKPLRFCAFLLRHLFILK